MRTVRFWKSPVCGPVALAMVLMCGCEVVPETGRRQLMLVSTAQEAQMGLAAFNSMKQEMPLSRDSQAAAMVKRVGERIARVANLPNAQWEFVLFESKEANAFCLPGGKVGVYSGILAITKDEAGLATVIGHEVAHAVARHGAERVSEAMLLQGGGQAVGLLSSSADPRTQAGILLAYGAVTKLGRELPHSRQQEAEADHLGLLYMARAGYNPEAAIEFWKRFAAHTGGSESRFLSFLRTHPLSEDRIRAIQERLPEARAQYRPQ
ncbi:MAG TPA: M48 family metallopeptidase [Methylomirabilota bacterium]|nr:M48 family metallopeptidase [Methylomirabilota bacterium]